MATFSVTDELINSPQAEAYFTRADRRVMIGLRATLELLRLPVPAYAERRIPGPTPAKAVTAAFAADNPRPRSTALPARRPNASQDVVAQAKADRAQRLGTSPGNLFDQIFSG
jgi:hypothetical protein